MGKRFFKLHFLITIAAFIALVYLGLMLRPYWVEKFKWESTEGQEETEREQVSENILQASAALTLGWTIFVTFVILFIILKMVARIKNRKV